MHQIWRRSTPSPIGPARQFGAPPRNSSATGRAGDPRTSRAGRDPSRPKSAPVRRSIQRIFPGCAANPPISAATWSSRPLSLGRNASRCFSSAPIRTIAATPGLGTRDAPFAPTKLRAPPLLSPHPHEYQGDDAEGNLSVPIRAPALRRRTTWVRSRAHRSEPYWSSDLFARAPAFAACERLCRSYPSWSHCRDPVGRRPTNFLNRSRRIDSRRRSLVRQRRWCFSRLLYSQSRRSNWPPRRSEGLTDRLWRSQ